MENCAWKQIKLGVKVSPLLWLQPPPRIRRKHGNTKIESTSQWCKFESCYSYQCDTRCCVDFFL